MNLKEYIAKRFSWKRMGRSVIVDNQPYVPLHVAEALFNERQNLVKKWKNLRRKHEKSSDVLVKNKELAELREKAYKYDELMKNQSSGFSTHVSKV